VEHNDLVDRPLAALAAVLGGLGVALGAFGAHALQGHLDAASLQVWHTAVDYQFWHALALLVVATHLRALRLSRSIAAFFGIGVVLFCGSLYALALGAPRFVGVITPIGGLALIAAWSLLAFAFLRKAKR
jgi:uncharacterized membrane protein YgdD (TMEM256/DUF423 family)